MIDDYLVLYIVQLSIPPPLNGITCQPMIDFLSVVIQIGVSDDDETDRGINKTSSRGIKSSKSRRGKPLSLNDSVSDASELMNDDNGS